MRLRGNLVALLFLLTSAGAQAQQFGLSFSYFLPRHGDFSTPISPFSIRGLGFDINRLLAFETGASLYRMSGMGLKDLPFESRKSLTGPNFTIFVPAELVLQFKGNRVEFDIKGGGFFFYAFDQHINYGNMDRAIREYEGWAVANSAFSFKNKPGFGYHAGAELTVPVTPQVGLSIETNYLMGQSKFPLEGSYTGGNTTTETVVVGDDFKNAKIDFTGLEFSIGLIFDSGGGAPAKRRPKRRR
jgi:hypothetical protein